MKKDAILIRDLDWSKNECTAIFKQKRAGFHFPLHWHDYIEFEILLSGHGRHVFNGREYEISAGDVWLMSYSDFHSVTLDVDSFIVQIGFRKGYLSPELEAHVATGGACCRFDEKTMEQARSLCDALAHETKAEGAFYKSAKKAIVDHLIVLFLRNISVEETVSPSPKIAVALAYIHEHFRENLSTETVARMHGFSPNYFGNLFKSAVGISFRDYLNKIRLKHACQLLTTSELGIKEIAFASGYSSIEYFFYVFKKHLFITPAEYRDAGKK